MGDYNNGDYFYSLFMYIGGLKPLKPSSVSTIEEVEANSKEIFMTAFRIEYMCFCIKKLDEETPLILEHIQNIHSLASQIINEQRTIQEICAKTPAGQNFSSKKVRKLQKETTQLTEEIEMELVRMGKSGKTMLDILGLQIMPQSQGI